MTQSYDGVFSCAFRAAAAAAAGASIASAYHQAAIYQPAQNKSDYRQISTLGKSLDAGRDN
jgi:hypothetical protein